MLSGFIRAADDSGNAVPAWREEQRRFGLGSDVTRTCPTVTGTNPFPAHVYADGLSNPDQKAHIEPFQFGDQVGVQRDSPVMAAMKNLKFDPLMPLSFDPSSFSCPIPAIETIIRDTLGVTEQNIRTTFNANYLNSDARFRNAAEFEEVRQSLVRRARIREHMRLEDPTIPPMQEVTIADVYFELDRRRNATLAEYRLDVIADYEGAFGRPWAAREWQREYRDWRWPSTIKKRPPYVCPIKIPVPSSGNETQTTALPQTEELNATASPGTSKETRPPTQESQCVVSKNEDSDSEIDVISEHKIEWSEQESDTDSGDTITTKQIVDYEHRALVEEKILDIAYHWTVIRQRPHHAVELLEAIYARHAEPPFIRTRAISMALFAIGVHTSEDPKWKQFRFKYLEKDWSKMRTFFAGTPDYRLQRMDFREWPIRICPPGDKIDYTTRTWLNCFEYPWRSQIPEIPMSTRAFTARRKAANYVKAVAQMWNNRQLSLRECMNVDNTIIEPLVPAEHVIIHAEPQMEAPGIQGEVTTPLETVGDSNLKQIAINPPILADPIHAPRFHLFDKETGKDVQESIEDLASRQQHLFDFEWSTGSSVSVIAEFNIFEDFATNPGYLSTLLRMYTFFRADLELRLQLTSTHFHAGRLLFAFRPLPYRDLRGPTGLMEEDKSSIIYWTGLPHMVLDAARATDIILKVPHAHVLNYLSTMTDTNLEGLQKPSIGTVYVVAGSPLIAYNNASSKLRGTVWLKGVGVDLKLPCYRHKPWFGEPQGPKGDEASAMMSNFLGLAYGRMNTAAKAYFERSSGSIPFDHPTKIDTTLRIKGNTISPLNYANGPGTCTRLGFSPAPKMYMQNRSEMDLRFLASIPVVALVVKCSTVTHNACLRIPVNPMIRSPRPTAKQAEIMQSETFLAYISKPFAFWRGTINFRFEFITGLWTTGIYAVSWIPDCSRATVFDQPRTLLTFPTIELNLESTHVFDIEVPYITTCPMKQVPYQYTIETGPSAFSGLFSADTCNGVLVMQEINPVAQMGTDEMKCWVWVSAGTDFEVFVPRDIYPPIRLADDWETKKITALDKTGLGAEPKVRNATETITSVKAPIGQFPPSHPKRMNTTETKNTVTEQAPQTSRNRQKHHHTMAERVIKEVHEVPRVVQATPLIRTVSNPLLNEPKEVKVFKQMNVETEKSLVSHASVKPPTGKYTQKELSQNERDIKGFYGPTGLKANAQGEEIVDALHTPVQEIFGENFMSLYDLLTRKTLLAVAGLSSGNTEISIGVTPTLQCFGAKEMSEVTTASNFESSYSSSRNSNDTYNMTFFQDEEWAPARAYNIPLETLMGYFAKAFLYWRGSIQYSFVRDVSVIKAGSVRTRHVVHPVSWPQLGVNSDVSENDKIDDGDVVDHRAHDQGHRGWTAMNHQHLFESNGFEVEVPYYSRMPFLFNRCGVKTNLPAEGFSNGFLQVSMVTRDQDGTPVDNWLITDPVPVGRTNWIEPTTRMRNGTVSIYAGAGNDFQLMFVVCPPYTPRNWFLPTKDVIPDWSWSCAFRDQWMLEPQGSVALLPAVGAAFVGAGAFMVLRGIATEVSRKFLDISRQKINAKNEAGEDPSMMESIAHTFALQFWKIARNQLKVTGVEMDKLTVRQIVRWGFLIDDARVAKERADWIKLFLRVINEIINIDIVKFPMKAAQAAWVWYTTWQNEVEPQAEGEAPPDFVNSSNPIVWALSCGISYLAVGTDHITTWLKLAGTIAKKIWDIIRVPIREAGFLSRDVSNMGRIFPELPEKIRELIGKVGSCLKIVPEGSLVVANAPRITQWMQAVINNDSPDMRDFIGVDADKRLEVFNLYNEGQLLFANVIKGGNPSITNTFRSVFEKATQHQALAKVARDCSGTRVEPFCICLAGEAGFGKSTILVPLHLFLANIEGHGQPSHCYHRNSEDDYWTGYNGQYTVIYDEFGAHNTDITGGKEFQQFQTLKSCSPLGLVMADISSKGTPFMSRLIIMATNVPDYVPTSVKDADAHKRRRDILVDVRSKVGKVTPEMVKANPEMFANYDYLEFVLCDKFTCQPINGVETMNWEEFKTFCAVKYNEHIDKENLRFASYGITRRDLREMADMTAHATFEAFRTNPTYKTPNCVKTPAVLAREREMVEFPMEWDHHPITDEQLAEMQREQMARQTEDEIIDRMTRVPKLRKFSPASTSSSEDDVAIARRYGSCSICGRAGHSKWCCPDDLVREQGSSYTDANSAFLSDNNTPPNWRAEGQMGVSDDDNEKWRTARWRNENQKKALTETYKKWKAREEHLATLPNYTPGNSNDEILEFSQDSDEGTIRRRMERHQNLIRRRRAEDLAARSLGATTLHEGKQYLLSHYSLEDLEEELRRRRLDVMAQPSTSDMGGLYRAHRDSNASTSWSEYLQQRIENHPIRRFREAVSRISFGSSSELVLATVGIVAAIAIPLIGVLIYRNRAPAVEAPPAEYPHRVKTWGELDEATRKLIISHIRSGTINRDGGIIELLTRSGNRRFRNITDIDAREAAFLAHIQQPGVFEQEHTWNCVTLASLAVPQVSSTTTVSSRERGKGRKLKSDSSGKAHSISRSAAPFARWGQGDHPGYGYHGPMKYSANRAWAQGGVSGGAEILLDDLISQMTSRHILNFQKCNEKDDDTINIIGFVMHGNIAAVPLHMLVFVRPDQYFLVTGPYLKKPVVFRPSPHNTLLDPDHDIGWIRLPKEFQPVPSLLGRTITYDQYENYVQDTGVLLARRNNEFVRFKSEAVNCWDLDGGPRGLVYTIATTDGQTADFTINRGFAYGIATEKGDCGFPLFVQNQGTFYIAGIHVAGFNDQTRDTYKSGFATALLKEDLEMAIQQLEAGCAPVPPSVAPTTAIVATAQANLNPKGNFNILGCAATPVFVNRKTQLRPSLIAPYLDAPMTAPAVLSDHDPRCEVPGNVLERGIEKFGVVSQELSEEEEECLFSYWKEKFQKFIGPRNVLSMAEAVTGDGRIGSTKMPPNTSMGLPYSQIMGTIPSRRQMLDEISNGQTNIISKRVTERIHHAERGELYPTAWTDMLKDERRPLDKIRKGKTRCFNIAPIDLTIAHRMYFLDFVAACYDPKNEWSCTVGISPESKEWDKLGAQFAIFAPTVVDADYEAFDGTIPPSFYGLFLRVANTFYDDSSHNQNIRKVLIEQCIHRETVAENLVYVVHGGNPSGFAMTTLFNCFVNATYVRLCWLASHGSLRDFDKYVLDKNYGDDLLLATKEKAFYEALPKLMKQRDIVLTAANKGAHLQPQHLTLCKFLKRGFHYDRNFQMWVPHYPIPLIYEILKWKKKENEHVAVRMNLLCTQIFMWFHGREQYKEFHLHIQDILENLSQDQRMYIGRWCLPYDVMRKWFFSDEGLDRVWLPCYIDIPLDQLLKLEAQAECTPEREAVASIRHNKNIKALARDQHRVGAPKNITNALFL